MAVRKRYRRIREIIGGAINITNIYITGAYAFSWDTFADGDATPDISAGEHFKTANTGATVITDFDNPNANGQRITVLITDANTTIQTEVNGSNIRLFGDDGVAGVDHVGAAYDILEFKYDGSLWIESSRDTK